MSEIMNRISKNRSMTIMVGGGLDIVRATEDALMDGWKNDHLGIDEEGLIGNITPNAKFLEFYK